MQEIFEWDENKRLSNLQKHQIDFRDIDRVFADPHAVTFRSVVYSDEARDVTIGKLNNRLVAVIHVRRGHAIRIISARFARKGERDLYGIHH